ncbi:WD40 repeat-like protein, partial [Fistulina hepatica ATCC 64428]
ESSLITAIALWRDQIIVASDDNLIRAYTREGRFCRVLKGHDSGVWALALSGDTLISASADATARAWDLNTGTCLHVFHKHTSTVRCVAVTDSLVVTGSRDGSLHVWRIPKAGEHLNESTSTASGDDLYHKYCLAGHSDSVRSLSAVGTVAASGSYDRTVRVWDLTSGECRALLEGHTDKVYQAIINPARCNEIYSSSMDHSVRIWDATTGSCMHVLTEHRSIVPMLTIVGGRAQLVSGDAEGVLCVWDAASGTLVRKYDEHGGSAITALQSDD